MNKRILVTLPILALGLFGLAACNNKDDDQPVAPATTVYVPVPSASAVPVPSTSKSVEVVPSESVSVSVSPAKKGIVGHRKG